jgi:hypothetical protein
VVRLSTLDDHLEDIIHIFLLCFICGGVHRIVAEFYWYVVGFYLVAVEFLVGEDVWVEEANFFLGWV